jgi:predicted lysophospholipase L1 biosynthesis ABC-type transport system permease subunit
MADVKIAAEVAVVIVSLASGVLVLAAFVWAAIKDGREDKALQRRLGIRRKTRLGR